MSRKKILEDYYVGMEEFIKYVWDELPNSENGLEQTPEDLRFDILEFNPFIPLLDGDLAEDMGVSEWDLAYQLANMIIDEKYAEAA
jgi:hypothetical protein